MSSAFYGHFSIVENQFIMLTTSQLTMTLGPSLKGHIELSMELI